MAVNSILPPYPVFADAAGKPLEGGYIYVGMPGFEARSTPKTSFYDQALTIPTGTATGAAVRTSAGFPVRNGSQTMIYADDDYSLTVTDKNGAVIYTTLNRTFAFGVAAAAVAPIIAPDGNFTKTGFGFINEQNSGLVRSSTGVIQSVIQGALVSQQSATGTVFPVLVSGTGFVAGVTAALNALLTAITGLSANGLMVRTSATTAAARSITSTNGSVVITNADGVAGNINLATGWSVQTPVATTAGTTIDFTGIPAGAKSIRLYLMNVSLTAVDQYLIQLGTSGAFVTTGYVGSVHVMSATAVGGANMAAGFAVNNNGAATDQAVGIFEADLVTGTYWVMKYQGRGGPDRQSLSVGSIDIAGALTRLRLTNSGVSTFDNGTAAISWLL